jgi:hypothetical protein
MSSRPGVRPALRQRRVPAAWIIYAYSYNVVSVNEVVS